MLLDGRRRQGFREPADEAEDIDCDVQQRFTKEPLEPDIAKKYLTRMALT